MSPAASYDLVVAITLGQQDLQILAVGERGLVRVSPVKKAVGELHRAILDHPERFPLWMQAPGTRLDEDRDAAALLVGADVGFDLPQLRLATAKELLHAPNVEAAAWLTFGLLGERLRTLEAEVRTKMVLRPLVLLFHTDRGRDDKRSSREPVAAAPRLAAWLRENLKPLDPNRDIREIRVLQDGEFLTEQDANGNSRLTAAVAQRIDAALHGAVRECPKCLVRLHVSGGIPEVARVVEAAALFRFASFQLRSPSEDEPSADAKKRVGGMPAVERLNLRRRCRDLVRQGQIETAALLARAYSPPPTSAPVDRWLRCLEAVSAYLGGYRDRAEQLLAHLADAPTAGWLRWALDPQRPQCLLVALRAESALRAGDVCAGAAFTGTLLDVAVFDAVERYLGDGSDPCVDWDSIFIHKNRLRYTADDFRAFAAPLLGYRKDGIFCKKDKLDRWLEGVRLTLESAWQKWLLIKAVRGTGAANGLSDALRSFCEQMASKADNDPIPAYFRNVVIHSLPQTDAHIQHASDEFAARGLWQQRGKQVYSALDGATWPARTLQGFGIADPLALYEDGLAALVADIEDAPLG